MLATRDPRAFNFFKMYFIDYATTVVPFISPLYSPLPYTPLPLAFLTLVHVHDQTCKCFGFSISHTILNLPLSMFHLKFMLLIPCTFSPILPLSLPADNPLCDLHFCDSVPVLVVHFFFFFRFSC